MSLAVLAAGVLVATAAACFNDPTSDLRGSPSRLGLSRTFVILGLGSTIGVNVEALDQQGNQYAMAQPTVTSDAAVATVTVVPDTIGGSLPTGLRWRLVISAVAPGATTVQITAAGVNDSIFVAVPPTNFSGTITASAASGSVVTIASTSLIKFDPAETTVRIGGLDAFIKSATADQLQVYADTVGASQPVVLGNVLLLGSIPVVSLTATSTVTVTASADEPANDAPATGTAITLPTTAGSYAEVAGTVSGGDPDDFYRITTTTADSIEAQLQWFDAGADNDLYLLNSAGGGFCALDGCAAAGSSDPEVFKVRLAAATTYVIYVNFYAAGAASQTTYRLRIYKR